MKIQMAKYALALLMAACSFSSRAPAALASPTELDIAAAPPEKQLEDVVTMDHYSIEDSIDDDDDAIYDVAAPPEKQLEDIVTMDHYSIEDTGTDDSDDATNNNRRLKKCRGKGPTWFHQTKAQN